MRSLFSVFSAAWFLNPAVHTQSTSPSPARHRRRSLGRWVDLEALEPRVLLSLSGAYGVVGLGGNHGTTFNSAVIHATITTAGHFTGAKTGEADVGGDGGSGGGGPVSGSFVIGADDSFSQFGGEVNGFVSVDGSLAAIAVSSADNDGEVGLTLFVHQGSGESNATLDGVYNTVILGIAGDDSQNSGLDATAGVASLDADGAGQVTGNITQVAQGQTGGNAFTAGPGNFPYTVGSNGQLAFSGNGGWVSNDGSSRSAASRWMWCDRRPA